MNEIVSLMMVEDNPGDADLIREMLIERPEFRLKAVSRLSDALECLKKEKYSLILLDLSLPDSSGIETFKQLHTSFSGTPIIVLTGNIEEDMAIDSVAQGAQDFLVKGQISSNLLVQSIRYAIERSKASRMLQESEDRFRRLAENAQDLIYRINFVPKLHFEYVSPIATAMTGYTPAEYYADPTLGLKLVHPDDKQLLLAAYSDDMAIRKPLSLRYVHKDGKVVWVEERNVPIYDDHGNWVAIEGIIRDITYQKEMEQAMYQRHRELRHAYDATIEGWAHALDLRDHETKGHSLRTTKMTLALARAMGISEVEKLEGLYRGALLHDIGKIGIPDSILLKPGPLTEEEWEIMHKHPLNAYEMLSAIDYLKSALSIPYCHHEKWDGTGYPRGLKGQQIPIEARIFSVVDVYDALTSDRPYRLAWPRAKALQYIRTGANEHFDPRVVDVFLGQIDRIE